MAIRSKGEMEPDAMNEMNVPVVCFIYEPEKEGDPWRWSAVNFMPRKEYCGSSWHIEADTKEELMEWIRAKVVPLYEIATNNLREFGKNYYWEPQTAESV